MNKTLSVLIIVLFLFVAGCTSSRPSTPNPNPTPTPTPTAMNCDEQCVAMTGSMKPLCMAGCYQEQAGKTGDASLCENIKRDQGEGINFIGCLKQAGVKTNSTAPCDRVDNITLRDNCYMGLQVIVLDPTTCDKVSDPDRQQTCRNMRR